MTKIVIVKSKIDAELPAPEKEFMDLVAKNMATAYKTGWRDALETAHEYGLTVTIANSKGGIKRAMAQIKKGIKLRSENL